LENRPDGFTSIAILAFVVVVPLIYFGPQLGAVEAWFVAIYRAIDGWVAPIRISSSNSAGDTSARGYRGLL
jgi:hypothetical protein